MEAVKISIWGNIVMEAVNRSIWGNIVMEAVKIEVTLLWEAVKRSKVTLLWEQLKFYLR